MVESRSIKGSALIKLNSIIICNTPINEPLPFHKLVESITEKLEGKEIVEVELSLYNCSQGLFQELIDHIASKAGQIVSLKMTSTLLSGINYANLV